MKRYHTYRRMMGSFVLLLFIGLPYLRLKGESVFRFDIPTLRLLFFGTQIWLADFFIILIAIIFLTFLVLLATTLFGRVWCGWFCPQTVILDAAAFFELPRKGTLFSRMLASMALLILSGFVAASIVFYFVSPYDAPILIRTGGIPAQVCIGSWTVLFLLLYLDLVLLRRNFCATVCPYARMQSVLFDDRTLLVAFDRTRDKECLDCRACMNACPVGIDIRQGPQMACIHCAECADACADRTAAEGRGSLIDYFFGIPGSKATGFRMNPLITGIITALSLIFLVYLSITKMPFDMTARLNYEVAAQKHDDGSVSTVYETSFRNLSRQDLSLQLTVSSSSASASIAPAAITIKKEQEFVRIPVVVRLNNMADHLQNKIVILTVRTKDGKSISRTLQVMMPENN